MKQEEIMSVETRNNYIKQLFGDKGEPFIFKILIEDAMAFGKQRPNKEFEKIIDDIDLELLFTDIKDKEGNKFELSDELMELFTTFWEVHLKSKLKSKLKGRKK